MGDDYVSAEEAVKKAAIFEKTGNGGAIGARALRTVEHLHARLTEVEAERDRLARILAVERGDESPPDGWERDTRSARWHRFRRIDCRAMVEPWGTASWRWSLADSAVEGWSCTAIEAMEAADRAVGGEE